MNEISPVDKYREKLKEYSIRIRSELNIVMFLNTVKKRTGHLPPANLMCQICQNWLKSKKDVPAWAYFAKALKTSDQRQYYAKLNVAQGNWDKETPIPDRLKDIMKNV